MSEVAVVTGSASGIGLATATLAAARGYIVIGLDVAGERPDERIAHDSGGRARHVDVTDADAVATTVAEGARLGCLALAVGAAGILTEAPFAALDDALIARTIHVHLGGIFNLVRACAHSMEPGGVVIALSSELASVGAPHHAHYVTAKAAITGFVRSAARELADQGLRVHAVAPGPVDTPLLGPSGRGPDYISSLPLKRLGRADEIARTILDVASWPWTTGSIVAVNGGAVIRG